ncbi:MAG: RidA family protein [Actinomycetota bacterium]
MDAIRVSSGSPYERSLGFSRAIRVGDRVLVSGTAPVFPDGGCPVDVGEQTKRCLVIIGEALTQAGAGLSDVVRWRAYLTDPQDSEAVGSVTAEVFKGAPPAATMVVVAALLDPRWKVEIEAEAIVG